MPRAAVQNYLQSTGDEGVVERYSTMTGVTVGGTGGGSAALSTDYLMAGDVDPVIKITTHTTANATYYVHTTISRVVRGNALRLWAYVPDTSALSSIKIYIASDPSLVLHAVASVAANQLNNGWNCISAAPRDFTLNGGESWANTMVRARVEIKTTGGGTTVYVGKLTYGHRSMAKVLIGLDDGLESAYAAHQIYAAAGMAGTFFINGSSVGTAGYLTTTQLDEMYAAGHDIGIHSYDHVDLTGLSYNEVLTQIIKQKSWNEGRGYNRSSMLFSHPYAAHNSTTRQAAIDAGMLVIGGWTRPGSLPTADGVDDIYQLGCHTLRDTLSLATAKSYLDRAITLGETVIFGGHAIGAVADGLTWTTSDFTALVAYIKSKRDAGLIDTVPLSTWYRGLSGARTI